MILYYIKLQNEVFEIFSLLYNPKISTNDELSICKEGLLVLWDRFSRVIITMNLYTQK